MLIAFSGCIGSDDVIQVVPSNTTGVTQNITVLTSLPSTFNTLHYENGILVSVT